MFHSRWVHVNRRSMLRTNISFVKHQVLISIPVIKTAPKYCEFFVNFNEYVQHLILCLFFNEMAVNASS